MAFQKAVKYDSKGRIALVGPSGSGKSWTALEWATVLAGDKRVAAIDTEHGSLSKYADLFDFDVIEPDNFDPRSLEKYLTEAEGSGQHSVFLVDSLSHFWMGAGGALEFVDKLKKQAQGNDKAWAGWKEFTPIERRIVDRFIGSPLHVIVTMRVKTEYAEVTNERGKKQRVKVGLQPIQREGLEYEFDLVGSMDEDNNLSVEKSRCPSLAKALIEKPTSKVMTEQFMPWLQGSARIQVAAPVPARPAVVTCLADFTAEARKRVVHLSRTLSPTSNEAKFNDWLRKAFTNSPAESEVIERLESLVIAAEARLAKAAV